MLSSAQATDRQSLTITESESPDVPVACRGYFGRYILPSIEYSMEISINIIAHAPQTKAGFFYIFLASRDLQFHETGAQK